METGMMLTADLMYHIELGVEKYQQAMEVGVAPELARLFLPAYGMYVRWRWTTSLQGVMTFLEQRLGHDAQVEIQDYAKAVQELSHSAFPKTFEVVESL
jgi:thymidylate synthase (FAD)